MDQQRLCDLVKQFGGKRIAVVGDFFLDKYLVFDPALAETSIETRKTANQVVSIRHSPGAAGNVVKNLVSLGAGEVIPVGFTGDDGEGYELRQDLSSLGCRTELMLLVPERRTPTYLKPQNSMIPGLDGESERYDTKNRLPLPLKVQWRIIESLSAISSLDAVIIADQVEEPECGVITPTVRSALAVSAKSHPEIIFFADSRRRIGLFQGIMIKPNQSEAVQAVFGDPGMLAEEDVIAAGNELHKRTGKTVFLTRSERGMIIFENGRHREVGSVKVDGPTDPTGAGDSATAGAVLALAAGGIAVEAGIVANLVASITVQCLGSTGIATPDQLPERLQLWQGN